MIQTYRRGSIPYGLFLENKFHHIAQPKIVYTCVSISEMNNNFMTITVVVPRPIYFGVGA